MKHAQITPVQSNIYPLELLQLSYSKSCITECGQGNAFGSLAVVNNQLNFVSGKVACSPNLDPTAMRV